MQLAPATAGPATFARLPRHRGRRRLRHRGRRGPVRQRGDLPARCPLRAGAHPLGLPPAPALQPGAGPRPVPRWLRSSTRETSSATCSTSSEALDADPGRRGVDLVGTGRPDREPRRRPHHSPAAALAALGTPSRSARPASTSTPTWTRGTPTSTRPTPTARRSAARGKKGCWTPDTRCTSGSADRSTPSGICARMPTWGSP